MPVRMIFSTLTIVVLLGAPGWAAMVLSDSDLATVSGGGVEYSLDGQGLPQDVQQPIRQGVFSPGLEPVHNDGMDALPPTMAVLQSQVIIDFQRDLLLSGQAQRTALALNLDNSFASDVVGASNVFGGALHLFGNLPPVVNVLQVSDLNQRYRLQGRLYSAEAGYRYEKTFTQNAGQGQRDQFFSSRIDQIDRRELRHQSLNNWNARVGKVALPALQQGETSLTFFEPWDLTFVPGFDLDGVVDAGWLGKYGAAIKYDGVNLRGPVASYDGLEVQGDDLLLEATLKLPELSFGEVSIEGCLYDCVEGKIGLGSIGGTNLLEVLQLVDDAVAPDDAIAFSEDGIILKGLGNLLPDELNLNTGFAFVGKGHFKSEETTRVNVGAEASFGLGTKLTYTLDLSSLGLNAIDIFDVIPPDSKWSREIDSQLIDIVIPITFIDQETPPFELEFDGVVLAQLGPGKVTADELESVVVEQNFQDNSLFAETVTRDRGDSSYNDTFAQAEFVGGQMTAGQAELLAMSEGGLEVLRGSNVLLGNQAQRDIRVLHGVNAVTSLAANSLNIGTMPVWSKGGVQLSLQQKNQFVQQR